MLASFYTAPGFATELMHLYLATDLTADPSHTGPEPDERLELEVVPFDESTDARRAANSTTPRRSSDLFAVHALALAGEVDELGPPELCLDEDG